MEINNLQNVMLHLVRRSQV